MRFNASNIDLPACFSEVSVSDRLQQLLTAVQSRVRGGQRPHALCIDLCLAVSKIVESCKPNTLKHVSVDNRSLHVNVKRHTVDRVLVCSLSPVPHITFPWAYTCDSLSTTSCVR